MLDPKEGFFSEEDYTDDFNSVDSISGEENFFNADALGEIDDEIVYEVDFSDIKGKSFASSLNKFNRVYDYKNRLKSKRVKPKQPLTKAFDVRSSARIIGDNERNPKNISKIIVPNDKKVIVEGVDKFILGQGKNCDDIKNIGYYKCKKLKQLVIIMNNNSKTDFNLELFNPSMPLDYLFATSGNLNNKVTIAGGVVSYSDVLYNILANPTHIVNAQFSYADAGAISTVPQQIAQPMFFKNKRVDGVVKVEPLNTQLQLDVYQFQPNVLFFDFQNTLNRPFIPDGMDVIQYKVLAGASVTFSFFYRQKSLKRFFFSEAKDNKKLL
jgi:hypothetical protein